MISCAFRYTTDIISSVVYGFKCHSLKDPNNDFLRLGVRAFEFGRITLIFAIWHPEILRKITLPFYHRNVSEFFAKIFYETIELRRKENIVRKDFLNFLMQLVHDGELEDEEKNSDSNQDDNREQRRHFERSSFVVEFFTRLLMLSDKADRLTLSEAAAHAFVFFLAGFETTSSTATYCLLELALNPDVQKKLQEEIDGVMAESPEGFTFDNVMEMKYLEMVFQGCAFITQA